MKKKTIFTLIAAAAIIIALPAEARPYRDRGNRRPPAPANYRGDHNGGHRIGHHGGRHSVPRREHYDGHDGVRLAADIVGLVGVALDIIAPPPVVVAPPPPVVVAPPPPPPVVVMPPARPVVLPGRSWRF